MSVAVYISEYVSGFDVVDSISNRNKVYILGEKNNTLRFISISHIEPHGGQIIKFYEIFLILY